jgi:metal-responsive CopG/Arc/MetJ family transcriptional regulator
MDDTQEDQTQANEYVNVCITLPKHLKELSKDIGDKEYGGRSQLIQRLLIEYKHGKEQGGMGNKDPFDDGVIRLEDDHKEIVELIEGLHNEVDKITKISKSIASDRDIVENEELIASDIRSLLQSRESMTAPEIAEELDIEVDVCQTGLDLLSERFEIKSISPDASAQSVTEWELLR